MAFEYFMKGKTGQVVLRGESVTPRQAVLDLRDAAWEEKDPKARARLQEAARQIEAARRDGKLP
jgi:hypothetical protein